MHTILLFSLYIMLFVRADLFGEVIRNAPTRNGEVDELSSNDGNVEIFPRFISENLRKRRSTEVENNFSDNHMTKTMKKKKRHLKRRMHLNEDDAQLEGETPRDKGYHKNRWQKFVGQRNPSNVMNRRIAKHTKDLTTCIAITAEATELSTTSSTESSTTITTTEPTTLVDTTVIPEVTTEEMKTTSFDETSDDDNKADGLKIFNVQLVCKISKPDTKNNLQKVYQCYFGTSNEVSFYMPSLQKSILTEEEDSLPNTKSDKFNLIHDIVNQSIGNDTWRVIEASGVRTRIIEKTGKDKKKLIKRRRRVKKNFNHDLH